MHDTIRFFCILYNKVTSKYNLNILNNDE